MGRKIVAATVLGTLLLPLGLEAQSRPGADERSRALGSSDEAQVFFGTLRTIRDYHADQLGDSVLWEKAIEGLLKELNDPYAAVFTPREVEEFREETTGDYAGIGVQISGLDGGITITIVFPGTPADEVGLLVGDRIVAVNGESAEGWTTGDAADRIRGEVGTTVEVSIGRDGLSEPIPYTIRRDEVHVSAVRSALIHDSIGYIVVDRVARGSAGEVDQALRSLESAKGVVLDLRRNPGGYVDESFMMADLFVDVGRTIASTKNRTVRGNGETEESYHARVAPRIGARPVVVLVDRYTASAAEIITGALQDHDRAVVLGERTFGKGIVQTLLPLPAGRQMRLTTGAWYTPLGRSLHRARTRTGELVPEDSDTLPVYSTDAGRSIRGGGGIFPDLEVVDDTMTLAERALFNAAGRSEVPLNLRIAEEALEIAKTALAEHREPLVPADRLAAFSDRLIAEGLPAEAMNAEGVRDYVSWRVRMAAAERAGALGLSLEHRLERDRVLTEAVTLLERASTQGDLFAAVGTANGARNRTGPDIH